MKGAILFLLAVAVGAITTFLLLRPGNVAQSEGSASKLSFDGDSSELKQTAFVPTLDTPIPDGKSAVWCASFQLAWDKLKSDVVTAINQGKPVVANIAGTVTDDNGDVHSYEGGHYLPIVGYSNGGATVKIADSADTVGSPYYDISTDKVANWIATRGYAA